MVHQLGTTLRWPRRSSGPSPGHQLRAPVWAGRNV